ncbi:MAG: TetR/AcrR family transcriptional regulator [Bacteroidaceae bacterium]|nr:TetR/AcrR family transcriptional regulator [Bacteroidaceae bacterium]
MIVATLNREDIRPVIVETALKMFVTKGIDSVRMDDIASELSISKRTLYEMFASKENLLLECFELHTSRLREMTDLELSGGKDVLSVTLNYLDMMIAESKKAGYAFVSNLDKYPKFKEKLELHTADLNSHFQEFLERGIEQGMFRSDIDIEIVLQAFRAMSRLIADEQMAGKASFESLVNSTVIVLFRGIATQKGMEKLDEYRFKFNNR